MQDRPERIPVVIAEESDEIAPRIAVGRIAELIRAHRAAGRPTVLGLATSSR